MRQDNIVKQRDYHLDFIRVIAMLFVICIHLTWDFEAPLFIVAFCRTLFFTSNGLFFLLSGRFALRFKEDQTNPALSYRAFYWKKYCSLIIPFVFYSILNMFIYYLDLGEFPNVKDMIVDFFWSVFPSNMSGHLWFFLLPYRIYDDCAIYDYYV